MTNALGSSEERSSQPQPAESVDHVLRLAVSTLGVSAAFILDKVGAVSSAPAEAEISEDAIALANAVVRSDAASPAHDPVATGSGALAAPVPSPSGPPYAALCVLSTPDREWSRADADILSDLAAAASLTFQLKEAAFVLSQQLLAQQLESSVEDAMSRVAAQSNRAWTIESVVDALVEHGQRAAGAALISVLGKVDDEFRFYHGGGVPDDIAQEFVTMDVSEPYPMAHTCRTGEAVVLTDRESFAEWPEFFETMADTDIVALISYPILDAEGAVTAVLGLGYASPLTSADIPPMVVRLGSLMRQGLERAAAHQQERRHASHLESLVIPQQFPDIADLEVRGTYLPPTVGQRVGGDLYDVIAMPDGLAGLVVADATGHDIAASQSTVQLRHALGMLSHVGNPPSEVIGGANDYLRAARSETLITCAYAQLDPSTGDLTVVNAGHPHPRILRKDGSVEVVSTDGGSQPLLGLMSVDYVETHRRLEWGDTLVLFTDGVIERRNVPLDVGEQALDHALASLGGAPVETIVEALATVLDDEPQDDVAILIARRGTTGDTVSYERLRRSWPANELPLSEARSAVRKWLRTHAPHVPTAELDDLEIILTELLTNARSASERPGSEVTLVVALEADGVSIEVSNRGHAFEIQTDMPSSQTERGRGLPLVQSMADVSVSSLGDETVVRAFLSIDGD